MSQPQPRISDDPLLQAVERESHEVKAKRALEKARVRLVLDANPATIFFASLALRLKPVANWSRRTLGTEGKHLWYNPSCINSFSFEELIFALVHEVMHCALDHCSYRWINRDRKVWLVAVDMAVNTLLRKAGFTLPSWVLTPEHPEYAHLQLPDLESAERYYVLLKKAQSEGKWAPPEEEDDPGGCGGVEFGKDEAASEETAADWKVATSAAANAAKQRGDLPGSLQRFLDELEESKTDWRDRLRPFLTQSAKSDYRWFPPNRRFVSQGIYLPSINSESLGEIVISFDTSGSISREQAQVFWGEVEAIISPYHCKAYILFHHADVYKIDEWEPADGKYELPELESGGTSHEDVFACIEREGWQPSVIVCLTDLYTSFPESAPEAPVMWGVIGNNCPQAPWGEVLDIEEDWE